MRGRRLILGALALCAAGCAKMNVDYVGNSLAPTSQVDMYFQEADITRPTKILGEGGATAPGDSSFPPTRCR